MKISGNADSMLNKIATAGDKAQRKFLQAGNKIESFSRGIRYHAARGERKMRDLGNSINSLFSPLTGLKGLAVGAFAAFSVSQIASGILSVGAEAQQAKIGFEVMLGSAEKGIAMYEALQGFANRTPFDNKSVNDAANTLLQFGVAGNKILPTLQMLGDVSGGNATKMSSLTLAFGQMSSAGRLMGQDLLQMINAGFNPLQVMAEQTGKSMITLKKEMESGAISSGMVENAFMAATAQGGRFYQMMEKTSQIITGRWSTLIGKVQLVGIAIFEYLQPIMVDFVNVAISGVDFLLNSWDSIVPVLQGVGAALGVVAAGWLIMNGQMILAVGIMKLATAAQWLLNIALNANPIGIVIGAIAALVGTMVYFYNTSEKVRGFLWGLWEGFKAVFMNMKELAISVLGGIGDLLMGIALFDMSKIKSGFSKLTSGFQTFGKQVADGFNKGYDDGIADFQADQAAKAAAGGEKKGLGDLFGNTSTTGGGGAFGSTGAAPAVEAGLQGVSGGGKSVRNVTFTVNKMFETFNVNSQTITEGARDVGEMVKKEILRGLRGAEQAAIV